MINGSPVHQEGRKLWQYLASISACILAAAAGTALAWTSPVLPQLYQPDSWLVITKDQGSWISSLCALGAIAGALPSGTMADKLGRKKSLLALSVPLFLSWAIIVVTSSVGLIYVARFLVGMGVGSSCVLVPTYVSEIAETSTRGTLGAMFQLFLTVGILMVFILGSLVSYTALAIICALVIVAFAGSFFFMPESPVWLISERRKQDATVAMEVLRGDTYNPAEELAEMQRSVEEAAGNKLTIMQMVRVPATRKAMLASFGAMAFQQLSGINAVIFYTQTIFEASGSSLSPEVASIVVAAVQMVMSGVAAVIVDRAGRKPLLMISSGAIAASLVALGLYFNLQKSDSDVSSLGWLPLTSLTLFMVAFSIGLGPVPWMLMGELFSAETKAVASGVAVMINWFLVFLVTKTFPSMNDSLGADVTFWIFAAIMAGATAFTQFFVLETKGKSFQEIQDELRGRPSTKSAPA